MYFRDVKITHKKPDSRWSKLDIKEFDRKHRDTKYEILWFVGLSTK